MEKKAVEDSRVEVREATRDAFILKARLEAIEGWREHEIQVLRTAGRDAVENLKVKLQREDRRLSNVNELSLALDVDANVE